jgi:DNA-binding PadR family transcriptional regulator
VANSTTLDDVIPLRPNDFHILLALTRGQKHGYRIAKEVEDESGGRIRLEAGNLQRTIQKLIRTGLVETSSTVPSDHPGDVRRKYYVITGLGRRAVSADIERMRSLVESVDMLAGVPARGSGAR